MPTKQLLASFGLLCAAVAQLASDACSPSSITVNSQTDLDGLADCSTLTGDLILGSGLVVADIQSIHTVLGNLRVSDNADLQSVTGDSLTTIGGIFELSNLTLLNLISLPVLKSVKEVQWETLPALSSVESKITLADVVSISDTLLESVAGLSPSSVRILNVNNNKNMKEAKFAGLTSVTESFAIAWNDPSIIEQHLAGASAPDAGEV